MTYTPPPSNHLCGCRKRGAWLDRYDALDALDAITANPQTEVIPIGVHACHEGIYHLTSTPDPTPRRKR